MSDKDRRVTEAGLSQKAVTYNERLIEFLLWWDAEQNREPFFHERPRIKDYDESRRIFMAGYALGKDKP